MDDELYSAQFPVEHKMFYVDLKTNANGLYVKISEKSAGRRHNVLIPASGMETFMGHLQEAIEIIAQNTVTNEAE